MMPSPMPPNASLKTRLLRLLGLVMLGAFGLQMFFFLRVLTMLVVDPGSTAFQRSQIHQLSAGEFPPRWRQQWVDLPQISMNLQQAVLAAEDSAFFEHDGIYWESIEKAWDKNQRSLARAQRQNSRSSKMPKIVGGSTITQQLAKNLFLSGERTYVRKAQEFLITVYIEALLDKHRILEIYLNHVEWGSGVFGAQAAAQRYFSQAAQRLSREQAARLSVMLPRPRFYERMPQSAYLSRQTEVISNRIDQVVIPARPSR